MQQNMPVSAANLSEKTKNSGEPNVRHGYWKRKFFEILCSNCFYEVDECEANVLTECPHCHSVMDLKERKRSIKAMTRYLDIENLREASEQIGEITRSSNTAAFQVGDSIQITEKIDGSNASIEKIDGTIHCFSRNKELNFSNTLNGFWNYIQQKIQDGLDIPEGYVLFGEWTGARNKIVYNVKNEWNLFDIYDKVYECYMPQTQVKLVAQLHDLPYVHELYFGPFVSFDHCKTFCHSPHYGDTQEGIVVKNQSKLLENDSGQPAYLKIVNTEFRESLHKAPKPSDEAKNAEYAAAEALVMRIITPQRIEKALFKLHDDGILPFPPQELAPTDLPTIAKLLPRAVFEDAMKEEPEIMFAAGEHAGKITSKLVMSHMKSLIL